MTNDPRHEQSEPHDPSADSDQLKSSVPKKKPLVEPTLSPSESLPDVTKGSFVGGVSP